MGVFLIIWGKKVSFVRMNPAKPLHNWNSCTQHLSYPRIILDYSKWQWVVEEQIPIPKQHPPSSLDELRNISKTAFFSKVFESFLSDWLLPIVGPYLSLPGSSSSLCPTCPGGQCTCATRGPLPPLGSSPQGAFLGIFFFIVKYNGAAFRPKIPRITMQNICKQNIMRTKCKTPSCDTHPMDTHCIYIDDLSEAEAVSSAISTQLS